MSYKRCVALSYVDVMWATIIIVHRKWGVMCVYILCCWRACGVKLNQIAFDLLSGRILCMMLFCNKQHPAHLEIVKKYLKHSKFTFKSIFLLLTNHITYYGCVWIQYNHIIKIYLPSNMSQSSRNCNEMIVHDQRLIEQAPKFLWNSSDTTGNLSASKNTLSTF